MGAILGCLAMESACCFGSAACKCCFTMFRCGANTATRAAYAALFLTNAFIAWLMLTGWMESKLRPWFEKVPYYRIECPEGLCYGTLAAYRITFSSAIFHAIMCLLTFRVQTNGDIRAGFHKGFWGPKLIIYITLLITAFYMPNESFITYGKASGFFAAGFILVQLVLLIDCAYRFSESCLREYDETENKIYLVFLVGGTGTLFLGGIVGTILLYIKFGATSECGLNQFFISWNLILCFFASVLSIHPKIQEANPISGLPVASVVGAYTTYIVANAVSSEPDVTCNPLADKVTSTTETINLLIGAVLTLLSLAYTTSNAAVQSRAFSGDRTDVPLLSLETGGGDSDSASFNDNDDEEVSYNYSFFHLIYALASMYVAMLLTDWNWVTLGDDKHVLIGKSWTATWVQIITSWIALLLYVWTTIAPAVWTDRDWR